MRIGSWNILHATNLKRMRSDSLALQQFAKIISDHDFDLIGLQEVDESQERSDNLPQIQHLSELTNMPYWVFARTIEGVPGISWRKSSLAHTLVTNKDFHARPPLKSYGIGIISKIPIVAISTLSLGRSIIGLPLAIAGSKNGKPKFLYVSDEPRIALAVQLENGWTVVNTHLSFVPFVNYFQLFKIKHWVKMFGEKVIILGDFNLPSKIPTRGSKWRELHLEKTYPSWEPKIKFDHIITKAQINARPISIKSDDLSDHLPLMIEIN